MQRICGMMLLASVSIVTAVAGGNGDARYYAIRVHDKLIGYAVVSRAVVTQDGKERIQIKSQTVLKIALLGKPHNTVLDSETLLDSRTSRPVRYQLTDTTNTVVGHVESRFGPDVVRTWSYRKGDERGDPVETKLPEGDVAVLGNSNFAHWQLLLTKVAKQVRDDKATAIVFVPAAQYVDRFELVRDQPSEMTLAGKKRKVAVWHLAKPLPWKIGKPYTFQYRNGDKELGKETFTIAKKEQDGAPAPIKIGGKNIECFQCEIAPIKNTFWITRDGRFVRARQGSLVIELSEAD